MSAKHSGTATDSAMSAKTIEFKGFRVKTQTDERGYEDRRIELHGEKLRSWLRDNVNIEDIYDDLPLVHTYELFNVLDVIKSRSLLANQSHLVEELVGFLENENKQMLGRIRNLLDKGQMSYALLKSLFTPGTEIQIHGEELFGGRVIDSEYRTSFFGNYLLLTYECISTNGRTFLQCREQLQIPSWTGLKEIDKLPVLPAVPMPSSAPGCSWTRMTPCCSG